MEQPWWKENFEKIFLQTNDYATERLKEKDASKWTEKQQARVKRFQIDLQFQNDIRICYYPHRCSLEKSFAIHQPVPIPKKAEPFERIPLQTTAADVGMFLLCFLKFH